MGRGGKSWAKRNKGRAAGKCSDESDEDYTVADEDAMDDSEDEFASSFDGDESEEIFGEFEDEEEDEDEFSEKKVRGAKRVVRGRKRNGVVKPKKKQKVSFGIQSDDDCEDSEEYEYDGGIMSRVTEARKKKKVSYRGLDKNDYLDEFDGKRTSRLTNSRKKNRVSYREQEDDDSDEFDGVKSYGVPKSRRKKLPFSEEENDDVDESDGERSNGVTIPRKENKISYEEQEEDDDCDDRKKKRVSNRKQDDENYVVSDDGGDDDDDDDDEFTLDEIDDLDDEEIIMGTKKDKKLGRRRRPERIPKVSKRKRNSKFLGKNKARKTVENSLATQTRSKNHIEFADCENRMKEKKMKSARQEGRKKKSVSSDSDFESSGLSDYEYTISEEEREQVREANAFFRRLPNSLRGAAPVKKLPEDQKSIPPQIKRPGRKGKEKEEEVKPEKGKQVCGICLSEEGKRTVQGTLNCCSHYFCFTCIMEWSKVESRCPLCKQRFVEINKTAKFDLRPVVIAVPERDQVYQPSEEELRGYLDPYENVMCTECQQGGDDALMLLCDLCDSPAHTYCVGLGHEVPEGNWYCEGCRPTALDTTNPQNLNPTPGYKTNNNLSSGSSPAANVRETFDLNEAYVPDTPVNPVPGLPSPRFYVGDSQAFTVLGRRRIHQQIRLLINNRRLQDYEANGTMPPHSGNSLVGSQPGQDRVLVPQHSSMSERTEGSYISPFRGQIHENSADILPHAEGFSARLNHFGVPVMQGQASTSADGSFGGLIQNEVMGINSRVSYASGLQQMQPCISRSNIGSETGASVHPCREGTVPSRTLQGALHTPF